MATYTFKTPVASEGPIGAHRLFYFRKQNKGITILKSGNTYSQARYMMDADLNTYDVVYRGGRNHTGIDEATKAALIAGGVGVTEVNFTVE